MLIVWFLSIKSLPNLLFGVLCLPGDQSHPFAQPTINPLACCICWTGSLGRAVFPPWDEGPNFGSYTLLSSLSKADFTRFQHKIFSKPITIANTALFVLNFLNLLQRDILIREERHFEELKDTSLPLAIWHQDGFNNNGNLGN